MQPTYCAAPNTLVVANHQILLHVIASFQSDFCLLDHARTLVVRLRNSGLFRRSMTGRYTPSIVSDILGAFYRSEASVRNVHSQSPPLQIHRKQRCVFNCLPATRLHQN